MESKIAKHVCFLLAAFFLLIFIFNSCKKVRDTNRTRIPSVSVDSVKADSVVIPKDTTGFIEVKATLMDNAGKPLSNTYYTISTLSYPDKIASYFTDSSGSLYNTTFKNTTHVLSVYATENCGTAFFSKIFVTHDSDTDLGIIVVPADTVIGTVAGTIVDCSNNPVTTGKVILSKELNNYTAEIKGDGTFSFTLPLCNKTDSVPVIIYAEDASGQQIGNRVYFSLNSPATNIGKIKACNNLDTLQFFNYTIDSAHYSLYPPDNPYAHPETPNWTFFSGGNQLTGGTFVYFGIEGYLAVNKPGLSLVQFDIYPGYGEHPETPPIVNITEDGPIGGYIAGNIKLKIETLDESHSIHDATCSFRVKRKQ
jgi:hypothetical protein